MDTETASKRQDCLLCAHYYITHDANFRYGCRALNFKSQQTPALVVAEASGQPCHYFQAKKQKQK